MGAFANASPWGISHHEVLAAKSEALSMLSLIRTGCCTIDDVRETIGVESLTEQRLFRFARYRREEAYFVDKALRFRKEVNRQFELLAARAACEIQEPAARVPENRNTAHDEIDYPGL
jgi:hypothetical protein